MLDANLFNWAPLVVVLPTIAFLIDWVLTLAGARAVARVSDRWSIEGSYELNPAWAAAVDSGRWFNFRAFLVADLLVVLMIAIRLVSELARLPWAFALAAGMLLLVQAPTLMNHAANLIMFRDLRDKTAASGQLTITRRLALNQAAWLFLRFAALWLALWVPSQQAFFLGGAIGCVVVGVRFWRLVPGARNPA